MSYGMVAVPKSMWKWSQYKSYIKYLLYHISIIEEKLAELRIDLSNTIKDLEKLNVADDLRPYLQIIYEEIEDFREKNPKFDSECASYNTINSLDSSTTVSSIDTANVTLQKLEIYRSKLKLNFGDYERIHAMLEYNIRKSMDLQARVNAKESVEHHHASITGIKKVPYFYFVYVHPILLKC